METDTVTTGAQIISCAFQFPEYEWNARTPEFESHLLTSATSQMQRIGTLVSEVTRTVSTEARVGGLRLFPEDEAGNPVLPSVLVRYEAKAIPL
jgi:hypothetical protein